MNLFKYSFIIIGTLVSFFSIYCIGRLMGADDNLIYTATIIGMLICIRFDLAEIISKMEQK